MSDRKIGVFICHCGGNISDYVDVEKVREVVNREDDVALARTTMFACSDASQQEMIDAIKSEGLDGIVVASCSPKLHTFTFRAMAERAGLNPYQYVQVNLREQDSWAHQHDMARATEKGIRLVRAGIAKCGLTRPLSTLRIDTQPRVLVVGAGVAGLRAALSLSDMGLTVYMAEKAAEVGGHTAHFGRTFPNERNGRDLVTALHDELKKRDNVTIYTRAELIERGGSIGDFAVKLRVADQESVSLNVGAIIVATGFADYEPIAGEFGYGLDGVVTLPEFKRILDGAQGAPLTYDGKRIRNIAYIYCVGSRQEEDEAHPHPNRYCSRFCCTAACHSALTASELDGQVNQFHFYRDIRTYGKFELYYEDASRKGSVFLRYDPSDPPVVEKDGDRLLVKAKDQLIAGEEIEIAVDLVVLVTGMVPRHNEALVEVLKLPLGQDGFFNEVHPKLRPVETVVDGVFIAGASQGPKTIAESVASSLAAVSKSAALLMKGYVDLEPLVARVDPAKCVWCDECSKACPYNAVEKASEGGQDVARIIPALCKGEGACVPVCPHDAIDVEGYTDAQITSMIESLIKEVV